MGDEQREEKLWTTELKRNLVRYTLDSVDIDEDFHFLRFEFLQRLNIVKLEYELAQIKSRLYRFDCDTSADELDNLRIRLHEYGKPVLFDGQTAI